MPIVSVRDVAQRAGVSIGTVSNAINRPEKVTAATLTRVQQAIDELGFVRNDAARQLRAGRSRAIGLVVLDAANPFFAELARGAEDRAERSGLSIILGNAQERSAREAVYLDLFEEQRMLGVLISPVGDVTERLQRLRDHGIPAVLVDRTSPDLSFSSASVDDVAGGELAVRHLLDAGRKRILFVGGPLGIRQVSDRLGGARRAVDARPGASLEVIETDALTVSAGHQVGDSLARRAREDLPDAIFAVNDLVAVGLLQALHMIGSIAVPDEIALIGYDDVPYASSTIVPLSSIRQPSALIGETAVDLLLRSVENPAAPPEQVVFAPELVVRESTGAQ